MCRVRKCAGSRSRTVEALFLHDEEADDGQKGELEKTCVCVYVRLRRER